MSFIPNLLSNVALDAQLILRSVILLSLGSILLGAVGRFVFGRRSIIHCAVSSAIGILFVYVATILLYVAGAEFEKFISPLPFIEISCETAQIFSYHGSDFLTICQQILSMVILAFLVNILDSILPRGNNVFLWLLLRVVTVFGAMALHILCLSLINLLPHGFMQYAHFILLALLLILFVVGGMKIIVGAVLTTINPLIGILYTFFFANIVGRAIVKAMLTTGILAGLVYLLGYMGVGVISITQGALVAYIPLALVLLAVWFVVTGLFERK